METLTYLYAVIYFEEEGEATLNFPDPNPMLSPFLGMGIGLVIVLTTFGPATALPLKEGVSGAEVMAVQKQLQELGYFNGPVTGYYGPLTREAVTKFQNNHGLEADGIAGSQTQQALNLTPDEGSMGSSPPPDISIGVNGGLIKQGQRGEQVSRLQKRLQELGYFHGPVTGYYGSMTREAVNRFQGDHGLDPDGVIGPATQKVLAGGSEDRAQVSKAPEPFNTGSFTSSMEMGPAAEKMTLEKTISGSIAPKSIAYSGNGLFFAQNMMYTHSISVYNRDYELVKTIPDTIDLSQYGQRQYLGIYRGAPVEVSFSQQGQYAWVSNYRMYGAGFDNPGDDNCQPNQKTDNSFLYRVSTNTLEVDRVIEVGSVPKYVATTPDDRFVLVSNWCSSDVSIIDLQQEREIQRIKVGRYPRGMAIDPLGQKAYIALMGSNDIVTLDLGNFSLGKINNIGRFPRHLVIDRQGKYLWATLNGDGKVVKIDLKTEKVVAARVTGKSPRSMVLSDDGEFLYVVNYNSNTVSKLRAQDLKVLQTVKVNNNPIGIAYDPDKRQVWIACYSGSIMVFQD